MPEQSDGGLALWQLWFADGGNPYVVGGPCDDRECFFCQSWPGDAHLEDCIYAQAAQLLGTPVQIGAP